MDVRVDKWLWAVRIYKSRSVASAACSAGKVRIGGATLKPSRAVHVGEVITAAAGEITRTVRVRALLERRVGANLVPEYMEDLTPPSEYSKPREPDFRPLVWRPKGAGRPTKKDRRKLDELI
jgi:ribosome-associated heat shock protein Hsp15